MKLQDLLKDIKLGKVYTERDRPPFQVNEGKGKFGRIYQMKDEMAKGEFDPKNPQIYIQGFGVWKLKTLEKSIARDLKECINRGAEYAAKAIYRNHSTIEAKIKAANDVYQQMNSSTYKRAVTMWKRKKR
jgi:hypothetical protein